MNTINKEVRLGMIESFRKAVNDKKDMRSEFTKSIKAGNEDHGSLIFPRPISANAHLLALLLRKKDYSKIVKSYSSPTQFWERMLLLNKAAYEYTLAKQSKVYAELVGGETIFAIKDKEFYGLVKLFNNEVFDAEIAEILVSVVDDCLDDMTEQLTRLEK